MKLMIIGAGGHGKVAADCAVAMNKYQKIDFLDGEYPHYLQANRWTVVDHPDNFEKYIRDYYFFVAIGNNQTRAQWHQKLISQGARIATLLHPSCVVGLDVEIGEGSLVLANAVINTLSKIGKSCIVNTAASVDHDNQLGDFVHLAPGSRCAGSVTLDDFVFMGIGSAVIPGISIGRHSIIGAGATVISNIGENVTAVGTPAKIIQQRV